MCKVIGEVVIVLVVEDEKVVVVVKVRSEMSIDFIGRGSSAQTREVSSSVPRELHALFRRSL